MPTIFKQDTLNGFPIKEWNYLGIDFEGGKWKNKTKGIMLTTCPLCSHKRKEHHRKQRICKVDVEKGFFTCYHCGESGQIHKYGKNKSNDYVVRKVYKKPDFKRIVPFETVVNENNEIDIVEATDANFERVVSYFEDERHISRSALVENHVWYESTIFWLSQEVAKERVEVQKVGKYAKDESGKIRTYNGKVGVKMLAIAFLCYDNGELLHVEYRTRHKDLKMSYNTELFLYGVDWIRNTETCIITEGRFDMLSIFDSGRTDVVSVPNGARLQTNNLEYLDRHIAEGVFDNKKKIIIAVDDDEAGHCLRRDLIRRFGAYRCYTVLFGEYKDANGVLQHYKESEILDKAERLKQAKEYLLQLIDSAKECKLDWLVDKEEVAIRMDYIFNNGYSNGFSLRMGSHIDSHLRFNTGQLVTLLGIPNMGKTTLMKFINAKLTTLYGWETAVYSGELSEPAEYYVDLITAGVGEECRRGVISEANYLLGQNYFLDKVHLFKLDDDESLDKEKSNKDLSDIDKIKIATKNLIYKKGVKVLIIDNYSALTHKYRSGENETSYITRFCADLLHFARQHDILIFLVVHPTKIESYKDGEYNVPTAYQAKGGTGFFDKCDIFLTYHRDKSGSYVFIQKSRFSFQCKRGDLTVFFNEKNRRFYGEGEDNTNWLLASDSVLTSDSIPDDVWANVGSDFEEPVPF